MGLPVRVLAIRVTADRGLLCQLRIETIGCHQDMTMTIPQDMQAKISLAIASLPAVQGKVMLLLEFDCGTGGHANRVTIDSRKIESYKAIS